VDSRWWIATSALVLPMRTSKTDRHFTTTIVDAAAESVV
jgi:hypothetical protein